MTTALVTAAPTLDTEVPKSWERACLADKRMSYMKDVEKGWAVITEMWNNETGAAKTVLQVSRRWGSIKGSIGRWTSFDVSIINQSLEHLSILSSLCYNAMGCEQKLISIRPFFGGQWQRVARAGALVHGRR